MTELRDLDDSLGGYLELFGTDGKFYLAKFTELDSLQLKKPESLLDLVWRRAEVVIKDGPQGEVFVPITYVDSVKVSERLGKDTTWQQLHEQLVTGIGQKMLFAGEQALPLSELKSLALCDVAEPA